MSISQKILLIEDDPLFPRLMEKLLGRDPSISYSIHHETTLSNGLEYLTDHNVDAILLDLGLPDSQGIDTFLKVNEQEPGTSIIVLTGHDDNELANTAVQHGAQDFLVKGQFDDVLLRRAIWYSIERKRAEEDLAQSKRELEIRNQIAQVFLTVTEDQMYDELLKLTLDIMDSMYGIFGYLDEKGDLVVPTMTRHIWEQCQVKEKTIHFPKETWEDGRSTWARAIIETKTISSNEISERTPEGHIQVNRHIALPLIHREVVIGLMVVANKEADYTEQDIKVFENIGQIISPMLAVRLQKDRSEIARERLICDIGERVKELKGLYGLSKLAEDPDATLEEIFRGAVKLIPPSWKYSEDTCGRIFYEDQEFISASFQETQWKQEAPIILNGGKKGVVQVFYTKELPEEYEGPFLEEERDLIDEMGYRLGKIIQQKNAMELLATKRRRLSDILEGTNVGTWEWNVQTGETVYNERWAEIIGYTLEELSPSSIDTWKKFVHPDELKLTEELLEKHFSGELDYYEREVRMRHKNGNWVWVLDRGRVATWTDDWKPLLMSGTHQDITKRVLAVRELRKSEKKYRTLFNWSPEPIMMMEMDGTIRDCNDASADFFQLSKEVYKLKCENLLYTDFRQGFLSHN